MTLEEENEIFDVTLLLMRKSTTTIATTKPVSKVAASQEKDAINIVVCKFARKTKSCKWFINVNFSIIIVN